MNKLSEDIILSSFLEELDVLEKQGTLKVTLKALGKVLREADLVAGEKGLKAGLELLGRHKDPLARVSKGTLKNPVKAKTYEEGVGGIGKFLFKEIGNTADAFSQVSKNVGKGHSLTHNVKQTVKNVGTLLSEQVRASKYKVIPKETARFPIADKGKTIQGKGLFKSKGFDRKVEGTTTTGDYIVKKRKAVLPGSLALTPVGFGAGAFILGSGKKKETLGSRTGAAVQETALWSLTPPIAQVKLISDMLK